MAMPRWAAAGVVTNAGDGNLVANDVMAYVEKLGPVAPVVDGWITHLGQQLRRPTQAGASPRRGVCGANTAPPPGIFGSK